MSDLSIVIDLPVKDNAELAILVNHRLMAPGREINNRKPPVPE
jgi:hypothetical protein